ncbi:MAG: hypothetical protein V4534_00945 [Myxococcota bacterium]
MKWTLIRSVAFCFSACIWPMHLQTFFKLDEYVQAFVPAQKYFVKTEIFSREWLLGRVLILVGVHYNDPYGGRHVRPLLIELCPNERPEFRLVFSVPE